MALLLVCLAPDRKPVHTNTKQSPILKSQIVTLDTVMKGYRAVSESSIPLPTKRIEQAIVLLRGQHIMLDETLAGLYGVETKVLNQAVIQRERRKPRPIA